MQNGRGRDGATGLLDVGAQYASTVAGSFQTPQCSTRRGPSPDRESPGLLVLVLFQTGGNTSR